MPIFDYCDIVYDGHLTIHDNYRLEKTQNRIARLIAGVPFRTPTDRLRQDIGLTTLSKRREIHRLNFYFKLRHDIRIPEYITSSLPNTRRRDTQRTLRNHTLHTLPPNHTTSYQQSFIPATTRTWNRLPEAVRSLARFTELKKAITQLLGPMRPPKYYHIGTKMGNILHTKIRLGISELNSHQFAIQKADSTHCNCGHNQENTSHFIMHCPTHAHLRNRLYDNISRILQINFTLLPPSKKIDILLYGKELREGDDKEVASSFQTFLFFTKRFYPL